MRLFRPGACCAVCRLEHSAVRRLIYRPARCVKRCRLEGTSWTSMELLRHDKFRPLDQDLEVKAHLQVGHRTQHFSPRVLGATMSAVISAPFSASRSP